MLYLFIRVPLRAISSPHNLSAGSAGAEASDDLTVAAVGPPVLQRTPVSAFTEPHVIMVSAVRSNFLLMMQSMAG